MKPLKKGPSSDIRKVYISALEGVVGVVTLSNVSAGLSDISDVTMEVIHQVREFPVELYEEAP